MIESFAREPSEITRAARQIASEISRHDLALPLIVATSLEVRLDGYHVWSRGDAGELRWRESYDDVEIIERWELLLDGRELELINQRKRDGIRVSIHEQLNRERIRRRRDGVTFGIHGSSARMNLVAVGVFAVPLHERSGARPGLEFRERGVVTVDEIGVLRDVMHDLDAGLLFEFVAPFGFDRADEVDEVKLFSREAADISSQRDNLRRACVEMTGVEFDEVGFIRSLGATLAQRGGRWRIYFQKLEAAVVREHACALPFEFGGNGGIAHADFLRTRGGAVGRKESYQQEAEELNEANCRIRPGATSNYLHK